MNGLKSTTDQAPFSPADIVQVLRELDFTHIIWLPDSMLGTWETALQSQPPWKLIRVCREGESWPLAAGLLIGGGRPLVMMQSTGLFESGDALRNVVFDLGLPVLGLIGARGYLNPGSRDSARLFLEAILRAWTIDYRLIVGAQQKELLVQYYRQRRQENRAGMILLAEN